MYGAALPAHGMRYGTALSVHGMRCGTALSVHVMRCGTALSCTPCSMYGAGSPCSDNAVHCAEPGVGTQPGEAANTVEGDDGGKSEVEADDGRPQQADTDTEVGGDDQGETMLSPNHETIARAATPETAMAAEQICETTPGDNVQKRKKRAERTAPKKRPKHDGTATLSATSTTHDGRALGTQQHLGAASREGEATLGVEGIEIIPGRPLLGEGSYGCVVDAKYGGKPCALKLLTDDGVNLASFERECFALQKLRNSTHVAAYIKHMKVTSGYPYGGKRCVAVLTRMHAHLIQRD